MGFFSRIKNKARRQVAPIMPMAPQPLPRVPVMPQRPRMPEALPPRRGPMNRGLSGLMNQMQGEPRMMMAVGGPLMVRAAAQAAKNKRIQGIADDIFGTDQQIMNIGRGQPGQLTYGARDLNRIRNAENAIMAGGGLGVAGMIDATNMFSEPASVDNISFMSPEAMGTDLANLRVGIDRVIDLARNKASEMGADINEYVDRARSAYDQQMENQRMQELDADQGMQPFSMLMGPDMPLFRPESSTRTYSLFTPEEEEELKQTQMNYLSTPPTDPRVQRMIEAGKGFVTGESGRTLSNKDREIIEMLQSYEGQNLTPIDRAKIDSLLQELEKKN